MLKVQTKPGVAKISFKWKKVSNATGYQIFLRNNKTGKYDKKVTITNGNTLSYVRKFTSGTYTFRMRAYLRKNGKTTYGPYSAEVSAKVSAFDKSKKVSASASTRNNDKRVYFQWKKVKDADGYEIYRYNPVTSKYVILTTVTNGSTTSLVSNAPFKYGRTYTFIMRAYAQGTNGKKVYGKYSDAFKVTTPPARVTGVTAKSNSKGQVRITWDKMYGAKGYRIFRSTSKNGPFKRIATVPGGKIRYYIDKSSLTRGRTYYYEVRAYTYKPDGKGILGQKSLPSKVKVK